ncbi:hypothetical protein BGX27_002910, partial [Mortierella sp. AM989]
SSILEQPSKVHILSQNPEENSFNTVLDNLVIDLLVVPVDHQKRSDTNLHKRAPPASETSTSTATTPTKSPKPKSSASKSTMSASPTATSTSSMSPDTRGDFALFGKPSVIGSFNLTSGILIYFAFLILFVSAVGSATWKRAKYRDQFREQQQMNMEGGRVKGGDKGSKGGDDELSDAALFKQASISKRALMKDVGPGGVLAANEATRTKIAAANGAGSNQQSGVRFGDGNGNNASAGATGRTGGMKKSNRGDVNQGAYEMNSYGHQDDSASYYQDNHDNSDYSRPPLTEYSDPYYSSGSSHSGYLDQVEDYQYSSSGAPHAPKANFQHGSSSPQSQYSQPTHVSRTNSSRMPQTEHQNGNNRSNSGRRTETTTPTRGLERNGSGSPANGQPSKISTQGLDRSGSGGRSAVNSPNTAALSRTGSSSSSGRTRVAPSPTLMHPTPIARSNSTRLPPSMRGGGTPTPSGLSQQTNNYEYS